jgi:hypothetical protein
VLHPVPPLPVVWLLLLLPALLLHQDQHLLVALLLPDVLPLLPLPALLPPVVLPLLPLPVLLPLDAHKFDSYLFLMLSLPFGR